MNEETDKYKHKYKYKYELAEINIFFLRYVYVINYFVIRSVQCTYLPIDFYLFLFTIYLKIHR